MDCLLVHAYLVSADFPVLRPIFVANTQFTFPTPELISNFEEFKNVPLADAVSSRLSSLLGSEGKYKRWLDTS